MFSTEQWILTLPAIDAVQGRNLAAGRPLSRLWSRRPIDIPNE